MKKCAIKFCRGNVTRRNHSPYCSKCATRRFKESHPIKYAFNKLRCRARERGKEFSLTLDQYEQFCLETGYDKLKGKHSYSMSINRKNNALGYSIDNIESVTLSHNSRLQFANMPAYLKAEMMAEKALAMRQAIEKNV